MPLVERYDSVLLKKTWSRGHSFWPRMSESLALRLHNAFLARSSAIPTWRIVDELCWLERMPGAKPTNTKAAARLRGPRLGRFMHKHYTSAAFLQRNLHNQWFEGFGAKNKLLSKEIELVFPLGATVETEQELWQKIGQLAHVVTKQGYERRAKRQSMTGEWIIYYVHEGRNFYLDIALHNEAETPEGEEALLERLKQGCEWEFPFAFEG